MAKVWSDSGNYGLGGYVYQPAQPAPQVINSQKAPPKLWDAITQFTQGMGQDMHAAVDKYVPNQYEDPRSAIAKLNDINGAGITHGLTRSVLENRVPTELASIAGRMAKTANPAMLKRADDMKAAGYSRDEIWKTTGEEFGQPAFFDGDNNLKWEIDDSAAKFNLSEAPLDAYGAQELPIFDALNHPSLKEAYPELSNITALHYPGEDFRGAYFDPSDKVISLGSEAMKLGKSVPLHEINHGIQELESFPRGGNPGQFKWDTEKYTLLKSQQQERMIDSGFDEWSANLMMNDRGRYNSLLDKGASQSSLRPMYEAFEHDTGSASLGFSGIASSADDSISKAAKEARMSPQEKYLRLSGEADARAVQTRMDRSMQERIDKPFYKDYDVPESEFIYKYGEGGGPSMSVANPNLNAGLLDSHLSGKTLTPEDMALYEKNGALMETPRLQRYNL